MNKTERNIKGAKKAGEINKQKKIKREKCYLKNPNRCKLCNSILKYNKRHNIFCNHSCSQIFNNKGIRRHGTDKPKCLNCDKYTKTHTAKFCSMKCIGEYKFKKWIKEVESKGFFEGYDASDSGGNIKRPKKYILLKQNGKCIICKNDSWCGKLMPFVLDHIDGDANNWKIENIRVICRNCDGQLDTYCGKNRDKSTRPFINSRNKDGIYIQTKKHSDSSIG